MTMGPIGDCTLCSKNHSTDECFTGDIHYDATSGDVYIYDDKSWVLASSAGTSLVGHSTPSSTHMHVPTSKPHRGVDVKMSFPPAPRVYDEFPTRRQYVSDELSWHPKISEIMCTCGSIVENHYVDHLAQVAIDASDKWDELLMAEEGASV